MTRLENAITAFLILLFGFMVLFLDFGNHEDKVVVYDCALLEYYTDVPDEVKEQCINVPKKYEREEKFKPNSGQYKSI